MRDLLKKIAEQIKALYTRVFGYDIFISYSRKNGSELAVQLEELLGRKGFSVFRDEHSLQPGDPFAAPLFKHCSKAQLVVALLSEEAVDSDWVNQEIETRLAYRRSRNKQPGLIPIHFKLLNEKPDLPAAISSALQLHGFPQTTNDTTAWDASAIAEQIESQFVWWRWRRILWVLGVVLGLVLAGAALFGKHERDKAIRSESLALANESLEVLDKDKTAALTLALEAVRKDDNVQAVDALLKSHHQFGRYKEIGAHEGGVMSLDFNQDLTCLASGGLDKKIKLWSLSNEQPILELSMPGEVTNVLLTNDSLLLATDGAGNLQLWRIGSDVPVSTVSAHQGWINDMIYIEEMAAVITAGADSVARVWQLPDLKPVAEIRASSPIRKLQNLEQMRWALGVDQEVQILRLPVTLLQSIDLDTYRKDFDVPRYLRGLQFSAARQMLVAHDAYTVVVIDLNTYEHAGMEIGYKDPFNYGSFTNAQVSPWFPSELYCTMDQFGSVRFYDLSYEDSLWIHPVPLSIDQHDWTVLDLALYEEEKVVLSAGTDGLIKLALNWGQQESTKYAFTGHDSEVTILLQVPDEPLLFSADSEGNIKSWNLTHPYRHYLAEPDITCLAQAESKAAWLAGTAEGTLLSFTTLHEMQSTQLLDEAIAAIAVSNAFLFVLGDSGKLWRFDQSRITSQAVVIAQNVTSLVTPGREQGVVFVQDGRLFSYNAKNDAVTPLSAERDVRAIHALDRNQAYLAFATDSNEVKVVDISNPNQSWQLGQFEYAVRDVAFSPNGKSLVIITAGNTLHHYQRFKDPTTRVDHTLTNNQPRDVIYLSDELFAVVGSQGLRLYTQTGEVSFSYADTEYEMIERVLHDEVNKRLITASANWLSVYDYDPAKILKSYE